MCHLVAPQDHQVAIELEKLFIPYPDEFLHHWFEDEVSHFTGNGILMEDDRIKLKGFNEDTRTFEYTWSDLTPAALEAAVEDLRTIYLSTA